VFRELPKVWVRRFFYRLLWARFSPWLPVVLAGEDLEGLRGKAYRQRADQLGRRGDGAVMWIYFLTELAAGWLGVSLFAVAMMLLPEGQDGPWRLAMETWDPSQPLDLPLMLSWTAAACLMLAMSLTDLFVIGAGFGIYVNNRTWLEGWDVELAFKRLGQRLGKIAAVVVIVLAFLAPLSARGEEAAGKNPDVELMREVKADKDFTVHFVMDRVPKETKTSGPSWLERFFSGRKGGGGSVPEWLGEVFKVAVVGLLLALIAWVVWRHRRAIFSRSGGGAAAVLAKPVTRVVMGMAVSADSLPVDLPAAVRALWREGRKHEALGLLYRGTISKAIDVARVEIQESDTEGDCLRRVEAAGTDAHPGYFRGLTVAWMRLAHAGREPAEIEVETLCREWPFAERRGA
jgi:hypothetical protein